MNKSQLFSSVAAVIILNILRRWRVQVYGPRSLIQSSLIKGASVQCHVRRGIYADA
jgi:hypothetical protein